MNIILVPFFNMHFSPYWIKKIFKYGLLTLLFLSSILIILDQGIALYVHKHIYTDITKLPHRPYGLLLGTSKYRTKNTPNLFYSYRLLAADTLFKQKKIDYILLSGDNRTIEYNEPRMMLKDLKKMGISEKFMYMDYAGFRTLDSVIRASRVFKANSLTIITQRFHCERALFIARYYDIDAICFAADSPNQYILVRLRELFARTRVILDLLFEKKPHFLGEAEPLPPPIKID
ncbi:SanA/YdcF family protein [Avibacterium paragallinarum]|uniref:SanA/YdcF family protein n=1 Tax=Avibacterium paragallinarum TaxID=728 RepID=UPI0003090FCB|nr:ElyC/SanA/YdcF family protein [Avibacterium paragallinarum]AZI14100.1 vancomycin high temperature exclusion protein [Avibacterium paragallinarum]QIR11569.1 DUF218 domain-containing protein [Avibacterium paragallinarum]QJE09458.1 DUF218 domain-containing protein [Avibacterium paragallinarum]QJE11654.1 DUF218 domain-containing protein [Avibacterium paragallinarum]QJE13853.1 DUF218 domain-containing protein [Avibacterium paragallinarum]